MGTDIYMRWNGMTKEDHVLQCRGFDIGSGACGYLRASIGMANENYVLRTLFGDDYWKSGKTQAYDFANAFSRMMELALSYLIACLTGSSLEENSEDASTEKSSGTLVVEALKKAGWSEGGIVFPGSPGSDPLIDLRYGIMWFESLIEFFELGMAKQKEGLTPYPMISWWAFGGAGRGLHLLSSCS